MNLYKVSFILYGELHHTTGESTYPSTDYIKNKSIKGGLPSTNAKMFITGYLDVKGLSGKDIPS